MCVCVSVQTFVHWNDNKLARGGNESAWFAGTPSYWFMLIYGPLAPLESGYLPALIRQANSVPTAMASLPSSPAAAGNAHFHRLPTKGRAVCQQKINLCIVHFTSSERTKCVWVQHGIKCKGIPGWRMLHGVGQKSSACRCSLEQVQCTEVGQKWVLSAYAVVEL